MPNEKQGSTPNPNKPSADTEKAAYWSSEWANYTLDPDGYRQKSIREMWEREFESLMTAAEQELSRSVPDWSSRSDRARVLDVLRVDLTEELRRRQQRNEDRSRDTMLRWVVRWTVDRNLVNLGASTKGTDPVPCDALTGWNDILVALDFQWTKANRLGKVKRLTRLAQKGIIPITIHEPGNGPPTALRRELVLAYNRWHDKQHSR